MRFTGELNAKLLSGRPFAKPLKPIICVMPWGTYFIDYESLGDFYSPIVLRVRRDYRYSVGPFIKLIHYEHIFRAVGLSPNDAASPIG